MAGSNPKIDRLELKSFLDEKAEQYNSIEFIDTDPIQVPHQFEDPNDIEIAAFLTASLAWGQKPVIIQKAKKLMSMMPGGPYQFLLSSTDKNLERFLPFVHRTFNGIDCIYFMKALRVIYRHHGGIGAIFQQSFLEHADLFLSIQEFRNIFFHRDPPGRTSKHLADVGRGASGKRLNMFLRWMVRRDHKGVDFGIWKGIPMKALYMPLDVHSGSVARKLGILNRKQNDWKAVTELTNHLYEFDPDDPVRYDYALFGLGSFEGF
jgi:uncharacterized protein (TIGR02757 family)